MIIAVDFDGTIVDTAIRKSDGKSLLPLTH